MENDNKQLSSQEFRNGMLESGRDLFRREILNKYHPDLRGFRALTLTQKAQNKFIQDGGIYKQKLRGMGIAPFFTYVLLQELEQERYDYAEILANTADTITELSLDTVLNDSDWDFKVKDASILKQIIEGVSSKAEFH